MASLAARPRSKRRAAPPPPAPAPWWGKGPPPHKRWPGATIEIKAKWHAKAQRWESPDGCYYFDADAADRACDFFPTFLTHHKGRFAKEPFVLLPYQTFATRAVFGWMRTEDGLRRFREVFMAVPKGGGKSPWGSGTGLYLQLCDREPGAEVYPIAADKQQARIVFDTAKIMVEQSPRLSSICTLLRDVIEGPNLSIYRVLSSDAPTKHGNSPHGLIFDEYHTQRGRELYDALHRSTLKRRQPLTIYLTHAGNDDESICAEEWERARRIQKGESQDESYLPIIFEAKPEDDWSDPRVWARVNPGFGVTITRDGFEAEWRAAMEEPRKLNGFLMYHLNRWVNQAMAWFPIDWWDARVDEPTYESGMVVTAGLDLAQKIDLASFQVCVRLPLKAPVQVEIETEEQPGQVVKQTLSLNFEISLFSHFWIPEDTMREREAQDRVPYELWAKAGLVTPTEGAIIDYDRIYRDITEKIAPRFNLKGRPIGYDPAFATDLATKLTARGFQMVEVLQNYQHLNEASHAFFALVKSKRIRHGGHRLLRWCAENVAIKQDDAGRIRPVKPKKHSTKRIDGVVASIIGLSLMLSEPPPPPPQSYKVEWVG